MNTRLQKLSGGSLLCDGRASEVADSLVRPAQLFPQLAEGLVETDPVIRGRTTHALVGKALRALEQGEPIPTGWAKAGSAYGWSLRRLR